MRPRPLVILGTLVAASALGVLVTYLARELFPKPFVAACEIRTFDHVGFFRALDSGKKSTADLLFSLASSSDPFDRRKAEYFRVKLQSLALLGPLVEHQVRTGGSTYACTDRGYGFLMYSLDYPTFRALSGQQELDYLWNKFALSAVQQPWWVTVTQGAAGQVVTAVVTLAGLLLLERRERKKAEQRIVVADKLP